MQVRHLVPIVALVAIVFHGGKFVKTKSSAIGDAKGKVVLKQRLNLVIDMLGLEVNSGSDLPRDQASFREFCKSRLKTRGGGAKEDQYKDPWGIALKYSYDGNVFAIVSAGPDQRFDTADDIKATGRASDY